MQLSVNKLQISELREKLTGNHRPPDAANEHELGAGSGGGGGGWTPDKIVSKCTGCEKEFSITRRKHHCRSCGKIFCSSCSEHVAPLPMAMDQQSKDGGKPVRVCDHCWEKLTAK